MPKGTLGRFFAFNAEIYSERLYFQMSLKRFEDFEHSIEEDNQKMLSTDSKGAKKQLLKSFKKHDPSPDGHQRYTTDLHIAIDLGGDEIMLSTGDEFGVVVKVVGFYNEGTQTKQQ
jgi:hypothetical protein